MEHWSVQTIIWHGCKLARAGNVDQAVDIFTRAFEKAALGDPLRQSAHDLCVAWSTGFNELKTLRHDHCVYCAAFSPDGRSAVTGVNAFVWYRYCHSSALIWDCANGELLTEPVQSDCAVHRVAFTTDGRKVSTTQIEDNRRCRLWDAATGNAADDAFWDQTENDRALTLAFSADGLKALVVVDDDCKVLRVGDVATGRLAGPPMRHSREIEIAAFGANGRLAVTGTPETAHVWDLATGLLTAETIAHGGYLQDVCVSPDDGILLTKSDCGFRPSRLRLWDATSGAMLGGELFHEKRPLAMAFSPSSKLVATGGDDCTARLWDARTGNAMCPPLEHDGAVWHIAFSPDSRHLLTGSSDEFARLWDVATGALLGPPIPHDEPVSAIAFSPDGSAFITASGKTARIWSLPPLSK